MPTPLSIPNVAQLLVLTISLLICAVARTDTVGFGSYTQETYAKEQAVAVLATLDIEPRMEVAVVQGREYLRVLGPKGLTESEARELLHQAHRAGFESA